MRIMLIVPTFHYTEGYPTYLSLSDFPVGVAYLSASLKQAGHEVIGVNPNNITGYPSAHIMLQTVLSDKIRQTKPMVIGLGGLATDYAFLRDAIQIIRAVAPDTPIVLGGQIVTNDAEDICDLLQPDYAIVGEADKALVDLISTEGRAVTTPTIITAEVITDLDSLPFPDYSPFGIDDMLDNHSMDTRILYRYSQPYPRPFVIVASRSCPFNCSFCIHGHRDMPYRARSIANIMAEITETWARYHYNVLMIDDELFAVTNKRLREFSEAVLEGRKEHGWEFDWMFQTHASAKLDLETLQLAKSAGCYLFSYGLESASPTILKSMNKRITVPQIIEAIEMAHKAKLAFGGNLIFGDIAETVDTCAESLAFWFEHCREDFIFLTNLRPYPGSKLFDEIRSMGAYPDKKVYYENIDKGVPNLTKISMPDFDNLTKLLVSLETSWIFVGRANNVRKEIEYVNGNNTMYKMWGTCPYCGEESMYRQEFPSRLDTFALGTGCLHCGRKMKVET